MVELSHTLRRLKGHARMLIRAVAPRAVWPALDDNLHLFAGRSGLEIGGPSGVFCRNDILPVYRYAKTIDGCNYNSETVWHASMRDGGNYFYPSAKQPGRTFVREACDLRGITASSYEFLLASHVLEHIANPLKALVEWRRVLKPSGALMVIVPDRRYTFDHRRPVTSFAHLKDDFDRSVTEDDLTHLEEIVALHDLARDRQAGSVEAFTKRSQANYLNRCLHHHVFDQDLIREAVEQAGFKIVSVGTERPYHIIVLATARSDATSPGWQWT